ncbi:MAG: hypothetical protein U5R06_05550 [candidate division KSB1 bacterium]|nr:hypothetical protein [candidate division KSB1 bacterium]
MKKKGKIGVLLLAIWLIVTGLVTLLSFHIEYLDVIMSLLAIAAGLLLLLDR